MDTDINLIEKIGIHDRENTLFEQYKAQLEPHQKFSEDGLHYLGDFFHHNECWGRDIGNEEELWNLFCRKGRGLVIITKDLNDTTAWDIREEHGRVNKYKNAVPTNCYAFYRNLRCWIYGLLNMDSSGQMPEFPDTIIAQSCFENSPWVRINLKKVPGGSSILYDTLSAYVNKFHDILIEQLKIYQGASIYIDCSRKYGIGLLKEIYPDIIPYGNGNDEWIYYSVKQRFIIVNSYHPAYRFYGGEKAYYNRMRAAVKAFFDEHPGFLNKCGR